jgi:hypothetical protein
MGQVYSLKDSLCNLSIAPPQDEVQRSSSAETVFDMIRSRAPLWRRRLNLSMIATVRATETLDPSAICRPRRAGGVIGRRYPRHNICLKRLSERSRTLIANACRLRAFSLFDGGRGLSKVTLDDTIDCSPSPSVDALLNNTGGISCDHAVRRYVLENHTSGRHHAVVSDFDAWEDNAARANLTFFPNPSIQMALARLVTGKDAGTKLYRSTVAYMDPPRMALL